MFSFVERKLKGWSYGFSLFIYIKYGISLTSKSLLRGVLPYKSFL